MFRVGKSKWTTYLPSQQFVQITINKCVGAHMRAPAVYTCAELAIGTQPTGISRPIEIRAPGLDMYSGIGRFQRQTYRLFGRAFLSHSVHLQTDSL